MDNGKKLTSPSPNHYHELTESSRNVEQVHQEHHYSCVSLTSLVGGAVILRATDPSSKNNLGVNATLLLTFDDTPLKNGRIYVDYYPVAWRVATFPAQGMYAMTVSYQNQLAFIKPQVSGDIVVSVSTWVPIDVAQTTDLQTLPETGYAFTPPRNLPAGSRVIQAVNKTKSIQAIGIGFDNGKSFPPPTTLLFEGVGADSSVTAEFTPSLAAYVVSDYKQNEVLRGAIQSPVIWKQDIALLGQDSSFALTRDASGRYTLTPDRNLWKAADKGSMVHVLP
ncbi:hypothetical protein CVT26_010171 [Gymnopilus dilepis]|uniref:Uncharacterized protein n=1 Tax=Gymnopilus dilepis TaxID=231916 RepID=A0A409W4Q4_9AGAR|nr:hypothetical protein CVT26_010171 [Gymnopilus dilepis]